VAAVTSTADHATPQQPERKGPIRRLYDWVIGWADTRFAVAALFVLAFAESSFFPIPPDVLMIAMCIGCVPMSYRYATWCSIGSVIGGAAGYAIGFFLWEIDGVQQFFFDYIPGVSPATVDKVGGLYEQYSFWIVFAAAFTPIPYKVITILAGVFAINFPMFLLGSAIGRSARFFLVAWLFKKFGPGIKDFIERRFALVTFLGTVLLVAGFVAIKFVFHTDDPPKVEHGRQIDGPNGNDDGK
jgi:membrane protein YqaA with SNARE-associated domain